jgi:hypothetical protein
MGAYLNDVRARQPIFKQCPNRITVIESVLEIADIKVRIECQQAAVAERFAGPMTTGAGNAVIAAQNNQRRLTAECRSNALDDRTKRVTGIKGRHRQVAEVFGPDRQKIDAVIQIVSAKSCQTLAYKLGTQVIMQARSY